MIYMKNILIIDKTKNMISKLKNLSRRQKKKYVRIGFFIFGFLLVINVLIMMIYLIDSNYQFRIFNHAYVDAVLPEQDVQETMQLGIVRVKELKFDKLEVGDQVIVYDDFDLEVYWVETITSIDSTNLEVQSTYDEVVSTTFSEDEILGEYVKDANFFGTIYYSASFLRGFIFLTISHGIIGYGYYFLFMSKKEIIE